MPAPRDIHPASENGDNARFMILDCICLIYRQEFICCFTADFDETDITIMTAYSFSLFLYLPFGIIENVLL